MKYRCLTYKELDVLHADFDEFLYHEGLSKYEWNLLQDYYSSNAVQLLEKYSDLTFEKVFRDVQYLESRNAKSLQVICCLPDEMVSIGIQIPSSSSIDLTDARSLEWIGKDDLCGYRCFKQRTNYKGGREQHIFNLIEAGFYVVDEDAYNRLYSMRLRYEN